MPEYTDVDLCDLEIRYKNDHTVLQLIETIKDLNNQIDDLIHELKEE